MSAAERAAGIADAVAARMSADAFALAFADAMAEMHPVERAARDEQRWVDAFLGAFRAEADKRIGVERVTYPEGNPHGRLVFRASVGGLVASVQVNAWAMSDAMARALGQRWAQKLTAELAARGGR